MRILVRIVVNALAVAAADTMVDGIRVGSGTVGQRVVVLLGVAVVFGLINAVISPVVRLLTLPLTVLTLGLFTFVVDAFMLMLTAWVSERLDLAFQVDGFVAALLGALVISVVGFLINLVLPERYEG